MHVKEKATVSEETREKEEQRTEEKKPTEEQRVLGSSKKEEWPLERNQSKKGREEISGKKGSFFVFFFSTYMLLDLYQKVEIAL